MTPEKGSLGRSAKRVCLSETALPGAVIIFKYMILALNFIS